MKDKKTRSDNLDKNVLSRNKGFYFEDIKNPEYNENSKSNTIRFSLNRVSFIFFIFLVVAFVFGSKKGPLLV